MQLQLTSPAITMQSVVALKCTNNRASKFRKLKSSDTSKQHRSSQCNGRLVRRGRMHKTTTHSIPHTGSWSGEMSAQNKHMMLVDRHSLVPCSVSGEWVESERAVSGREVRMSATGAWKQIKGYRLDSLGLGWGWYVYVVGARWDAWGVP